MIDFDCKFLFIQMTVGDLKVKLEKEFYLPIDRQQIFHGADRIDLKSGSIEKFETLTLVSL